MNAEKIPKWTLFHEKFESRKIYDDPLGEVDLRVDFTSSSGRKYSVNGFWDGGDMWRVRFAPDELGAGVTPRTVTILPTPGYMVRAANSSACHIPVIIRSIKAGGFSCRKIDVT